MKLIYTPLFVGMLGLLAAAQARAVEPIRIMPLGDSITCGTVPGGYRTELWKDLKTAGYAVDFVGSRNDNSDPANLPDSDHNGYPGCRIDEIDPNIVNWMKATKPAVVLLHIGTNDAAQNYDFSNVSTRLSNLISHITTTSPQTHLIVAKITPSTVAAYESTIETYNDIVADVVAGHANRGERVTLVDMHAAVPLSDIADAVHPNQAGYNRMGDTWFNAIHSLGTITNPVETPEPGSAILLFLGLLGIGTRVLWRRNSHALAPTQR